MTTTDVGPAMQRRIVVGVDGSEGAQTALDWAVNEARIRGDSVDAISSWAIPPLANRATSSVAPSVSSDLQNAAQVVLAKALASLVGAADVVVRALVVEGPASAVLLEAAQGAELLVVGTRGCGGLGGLLLGSTTQHVVYRAACPVILIAAQRTPASPDGPRDPGCFPPSSSA